MYLLTNTMFLRFWSPETSDWETFRSQLNTKASSEMKIDNNSINSKYLLK